MDEEQKAFERLRLGAEAKPILFNTADVQATLKRAIAEELYLI